MLCKAYATEMFERYKMMIHKKAWQLSRRTRLDYKELCSDGYLLFLEALERYEEGQYQFSTYLQAYLKGILDLHYRQNKDILHFDYTDDPSILSIEHFGTFKEAFDLYDAIERELSIDAQRVVRHVLSSNKRRQTENSIRLYFIKFFGWSNKQVDLTIGEIKRWWACYA